LNDEPTVITYAMPGLCETGSSAMAVIKTKYR